MTLNQLLNDMWMDYCHLNPAAKKIYDLLSSSGEQVLNDHIALRTFNHPHLGIESLAIHFKNMGYVEKNDYHFVEKKLYAKHYEHSDPTQPKIFISELLLEKMSPFVQKTLNELVEKVTPAMKATPHFAMMGRPWEVSHQTYLELAKESEYASWVAAYGFRPNHFTVNINALKGFEEVAELNAYLKKNGYVLNASGGEIKGTPADYLEQSSTMASEIPVKFTDGEFMIPGCYYEFAKRYRLENGHFYQGFVAKSADKIFESTNRLQS